MQIEYVGLNRLSYEKAKKIVPRSYLSAYKWLEDHEGRIGPRPWRSHTPADVEVKLVAQRGIHKPGLEKYALTVSSSDDNLYNDRPVEYLSDGTWVFSYSPQVKQGFNSSADIYNESLVACYEDGIPVGVFVKQSAGGYKCLGLAFVEHIDRFPERGMVFRLHGPVNSTQDPSIWLEVSSEKVELALTETNLDVEDLQRDERVKKLVHRIRREQQTEFRRSVLKAYDYSCAITQSKVTSVLEAAHISRYLGPRAQIVNNGLALRADIHLLYDRYLLSLEPDSMEIQLAPELLNSEYALLAERKILLPETKSDRPDLRLVKMHFAEFCHQTKQRN